MNDYDYSSSSEGIGAVVNDMKIGKDSATVALSPPRALPVDFNERLQALQEQELTVYKTKDYIEFSKLLFSQEQLSSSHDEITIAHSASSDTDPHQQTTTPTAIQGHWREVIGEWAYNLIDHFECPREVVSICMNYIDRYTYKKLQDDQVVVTKKQFQLLSVTCLYLAIKMSCPALLTLDSMTYLSRDVFTAEEIATMELDILQKLNYQLHPPTSYIFLRHELLMLHTLFYEQLVTNKVQLVHVLEAARFSLELSVLDYSFINHRPFHVSLAALLNALEEERVTLAQEMSSELLLSLCGDQDVEVVRICQRRLRQLHSDLTEDNEVAADDANGQQQGMMVDEVIYDEYGRALSPISVATKHQLG